MLVGIDEVGSVDLIDHMGDDIRIVDAARVSVSGMKFKSSDERLIKRLMKDKHTSPFEHVHYTFKILAPIFVARQMVRHRTANWSEKSLRYTVSTNLFYIPKYENIRSQHPTNMQMSGDQVDHEEAVEFVETVRYFSRMALERYNEAVAKGVSRETARIILPPNVYTEWYWTIDLHNLFHFLRLRLASDAQLETRMYAETIYKLAKPICPIAFDAFDGTRDPGES